MRRTARIVAVGLLALDPPLPAMPADAARAWRADLQAMAAALVRTHKDLFHQVSRERFAGLVATLDARIPALERHEVIVELARIVAAVGDGHTNVYPTRDPQIGFHTLPVAFTFFGDGLYVRAAEASRRSLLGARVLRLGNRDAGEAYAAVKTMIGHDNEQGARYWAQYLLAMPEVLHALGITPALDNVPLTLWTGRGAETVVLHPAGPVALMAGDTATLFDRRDGWVDVRDLAGRPDPLWLRGGGVFHFEHVAELLYVQINAIADAEHETLAQFAERLRREIATTKPRQVVFDLRLDRGGNGSLIPPLLRAVIQSPEIDRKGRLFAIIGPATFSAAQMLVDALEKYTHVTFVGERTGSKGNHFGDSRRIVLPHSGITVRAATLYWQDWHPLDTRDATAPDLPAPLTLETYRNAVDPALEAIAGVEPEEP